MEASRPAGAARAKNQVIQEVHIHQQQNLAPGDYRYVPKIGVM
jgi:hypothetical protein